MTWRVLEGETGPFVTIFTEKLTTDLSAALNGAVDNGYRLIGRHTGQSACLAKGASDYLVFSARSPDSGPGAVGIVVDDPESVLEFGWQDDRFDVFSSGAVGPLRLHLPGLRFRPDGNFIYLIARGGEEHFFAVDFEPVKEL